MSISIDRLDHIVLNCRDVEATAAWYGRVLGLERQDFGAPAKRTALTFGRQKIKLRPTGAANWITGAVDAPGSDDFCFVTEAGLAGVLRHLRETGVEIVEGPVRKTGALGPMSSVYLRDPDGNLVEIASYDPVDATLAGG